MSPSPSGSVPFRRLRIGRLCCEVHKQDDAESKTTLEKRRDLLMQTWQSFVGCSPRLACRLLREYEGGSCLVRLGALSLYSEWSLLGNTMEITVSPAVVAPSKAYPFVEIGIPSLQFFALVELFDRTLLHNDPAGWPIPVGQVEYVHQQWPLEVKNYLTKITLDDVGLC